MALFQCLDFVAKLTFVQWAAAPMLCAPTHPPSCLGPTAVYCATYLSVCILPQTFYGIAVGSRPDTKFLRSRLTANLINFAGIGVAGVAPSQLVTSQEEQL